MPCSGFFLYALSHHLFLSCGQFLHSIEVGASWALELSPQLSGSSVHPQAPFSHLLVLWWLEISFSSGWAGICYVDEEDPELLSLQ